ncbi:unnamed protein product [Pseudo-nitzschia multistriata]|uniref:Calcineurin-like phosphoesterase domain-containing protein n=1 Tax=Pseudo-nitzschia multistriata TaxID=183589 RepID=A0A448Z7S8_9STRA|nr:unnamed protein product [Pseudo-nitzschia multistriata]
MRRKDNPLPSLHFSSLVTLYIAVSVLLIARHDRSPTTTMAWTMIRRSCRQWFPSRNQMRRTGTNHHQQRAHKHATTSPGLWTSAAPSAAGSSSARTFLDSRQHRHRSWGMHAAHKPSHDGGDHYSSSVSRKNRRRPRRLSSSLAATTSASSSSSRLYRYRDFLEKGEHDRIVLSYLTDIEGDKFYLDRYVDNSKILTWIPSDDDAEPPGNDTEQSPFSLSYYSCKEYPPARFPYNRRMDFVDSNSMLVFGGDLWDKGGFDLYVTRQLMDLKRRYPDRVVWVLGNRDINKLRMMQELGLPPAESSTDKSNTGAAAASNLSVPYHPGLTWFRGSGRVGDPSGPLPSMVPGDRLRWILGNTMGSPDAMEHRRQELAWEAGGCRETGGTSAASSAEGISDCDVVRSYQESCHPRGEMGRFLAEGLLAAKVGPILFVHGSLPLTKDTMERGLRDGGDGSNIWDDLTFCMPWINKTHHEYSEDHRFESASDLGVETIEDWLDAVNRFASRNVEAWERDIARLEREAGQQATNATHNASDGVEEESKDSIWAYRAGYGNGPSHSGIYYSDLVQYGMGMIPGGKKNPTVVYNSFTPEGMPTFFLPPEESGGTNGDCEEALGTEHASERDSGNNPSSSESDVAICTRQFFERSSMRLILTGHKPQGDMPSPIRVDRSSWVICADTSYSGDTKWFHDERNATNPSKMERRKRQEEEQHEKRKRSNLGRGNSISFRGETAVSEVLVELSGKDLSPESVSYHGVLSDGTEYESVNLLDDGEDESGAVSADDAGSNSNGSGSCGSLDSMPATAAILGRVAPTNMVPDPLNSPHEGRWWTKGICRDGSHLYYAGEGYNVWNYIVSPSDIDGNRSNTKYIDNTASESDAKK